MYQPLTNQSKPPQNVSWEEAQRYCNFMLFKPRDKFLEKFKTIETSLRIESSTDFASHRCLLQSEHSLISIKQFLYDWAPPAYDHPSLWRNAEVSPQASTPIPKPVPVGSQIAWIGLNFRRQQAATLSLMRTMVEVTIIEGNAIQEEVLELFNSLAPADTAIAEKIIHTPLAMLTYLWRHKRNASPVPLSYWKYTRSDQESHTAYLPQDIKHEATPEKIFNQYVLNSIFVIGNPDSPAEIEYYYEHTEYPGAYIRLLSITQDVPSTPKLGDQFCYSENLMIEGQSLSYAYLTKEFGPHEAMWVKNKPYLILVKPMLWTTREWFLENIGSLLRI